MGLVYDPERVGAGEIPATNDGQPQRDAAIVLGESLLELTQDQELGPNLLFYLFYGSAAIHWRPVADRRSDVDVVSILDDMLPNSVLTRHAIKDRIQGVEAYCRVQANPIVYRSTVLEGDDRVNPFYAGHLAMMREMLSPPLRYEKLLLNSDPRRKSLNALTRSLPFVEAWQFAIEYLKARRLQFQTQLDQEEPDLTALKGPFELPRNLGRALGDLYELYLAQHDPNAYDPEADEISSPIDVENHGPHNLLAVIEATDTFGQIGDDVLRLSELDSDYTQLLEAVVSGHVSIDDYEKWLRSVYTEALERAFKVATMGDVVVKRMVELAKIDPDYDKVREVDAKTLMYPEELPWFKENAEVSHFGPQIVPVAYDLNSLLFRIEPKYPDIARRYKERLTRH